MTYIDLINNFWVLNEQGCFTPTETKVYFSLLNISNRFNWKQPFNQSNARLAVECGVTEPTLINARNVLQQRGLIKFKSEAGRRKNTEYYLKYFSNSDSNYDSNSDSISDSISHEKPLDNIRHILTKNKDKTRKEKNKCKIPELQEVEKFFDDNGYSVEIAKKAFQYYEDGNWHDSKGNPVIAWKQKMRVVWFKDENKIKTPVTPERKGIFKKAIQIIPDSLCVIYEDNFSSRCTPQEAQQFKECKIDISYFDKEF